MKSLGTTLIWRFLVGGALLLGAEGLAVYWQMRAALTAEFDSALKATAQSVASLAEQKKGRIKMEPMDEEHPQFVQEHGGEIFLLTTIDGREVQRSHSLGSVVLKPPGSATPEPAYFTAQLSDGRAMRCVAFRFHPKEEDEEDENGERRPRTITQAILIVGRDQKSLRHTLADLGFSLALAGGGALAVLLALVYFGVRSGLLPLTRLGEQMATVDAATLGTRVDVEPLPSELQPVAARLNELLARLEEAFARERRFTATAAHELRTPLAELRSLAEVNLATPATEAERSESWRDALATTLRMESLALKLLDLARTENMHAVLRHEAVSLREAVGLAWKACAGCAKQRGVEFQSDLPEYLSVHTDPALLGVVLGNLCANAAKHAPGGTLLRVGAAHTGNTMAITFRNPAPELVADDLPHLFERFWRKDAARTDGRHHGLGLALALEIAVLLGGSLAAKLLAAGELEMTLYLPLHNC